MQEQIDAVQRMQDYIGEHIREKLSFAEVAKQSLFSPWYARRLFLSLTGLTPAEYIRKLRLRQSALLLRDSDMKILDVAMDLGFESVDGYQRAFKREFGCNPKKYARKPVPLRLFTPYGVKFRYLERAEKTMDTKNVFITVTERPERKVIVRRGLKAEEYWSYCEEVGCDVWGILTSIRSLCGEPVCMWLPETLIKPGTSRYVQGVEVAADYDGEVPDGFEVIDLPRAKYLMFQGEPFEEEHYERAIRDIWDAEEKYDPSLLGYAWDSENPKIQLEPRGDRGYIELMPIK